MQAPVKFELAEGSGSELEGKRGSLTVRALNRFFFSSTAELVLTWRILCDGFPVPVGDPLQQSPDAWHPGGSPIVPPQVLLFLPRLYPDFIPC